MTPETTTQTTREQSAAGVPRPRARRRDDEAARRAGLTGLIAEIEHDVDERLREERLQKAAEAARRAEAERRRREAEEQRRREAEERRREAEERRRRLAEERAARRRRAALFD